MRRLVAVLLLVAGSACGGDGVHHLPPETILDSGPPSLTNQLHATFQFHADGTADGFQCTVDGTTTSCDSPFDIDVSEGTHHFSVAATLGNTSGDAVDVDWTTDVTPPDTTITSSPAAVDTSTAATFVFEGTDGATSFECATDSGAFAACTSPTTISPGDGAHTFEVRAIDAAGNVDQTPATFTWTLDSTLPDTTLTAGPDEGTTTGPATSFAFSGTDAGGTFECSLDGAAFGACSPPVPLAGLSDGAHAFAVRSIDSHGLADPTPATRNWTVDAVAPTVTITTHPTDPTNSTAAGFTFTASETSTFECSLDSPTGFGTCTSPLNLGVSDGAHTLLVRATDAVGNTGASASFAWTVDTVVPVVAITSAPPALTNSASASIAFTTTEGTLTCQLDGGGFAACSSPDALTGLADGDHTFVVVATDAAGNTGSASTTWTVDTAAPAVTFVTTPTNPSSSTTGAFTFTTTETATTQCKLDGGGFTACTSPKSFTGLSNGSHTVQVRATDAAGNTGTPASFTWTVDTVAPTVTFTTTPANPTNSTTATFAFTTSEAGSTTDCQLDGGAFTACTSPKTFTGLSQGSHTVAVRATDTAGNTGTAATFAWTVDTTGPTVTFTTTPNDPSGSTTGTFAFTANEAGSTFECEIDGGAFAACTSPKSFTGLAQGAHTVQVRATDTAGNTGTPATFTWNVDLTGPGVTFTSTPSNPSNSTTGTFAFTTEAGATTQCQLDGGAFAPCTSPKSFTGLSQGSHTVVVKATDTAGNTGVPASFTWTIDTTAPTVTFTSTPSNPSNSTAATFAFTASETATTDCNLDGGGFVACTSPKTFAGLADGSHTLQVRATDTAGNTGSPASFTWTVDTAAPTVTFTATPANPSNSTTGTFSFTASEAGSTFQCALDAGGFAACSSPKSFTALADGSHTVQVKATDTAGNTGSPASFTWTVDTSPPTVAITAPPNGSTQATTTVSVVFSTEATATTQCAIDAGGFSACTSPKAFAGLAQGSHTVQVKATDTAGNTGTAASVTFTVDTVAPTVTFTTTPANPTNSTTGTFAFTASESGATFQCQLDGGGFAACTSPKSFTGLADGSHTVQVKATDAAGNTGAPASFTWTVDTVAPTVTFTATPANPSNSTTGTFSFTASESGSTFQCQIDGGGFTACTSPKSFTGLAQGSHTVQVKATDGAGNTGTPASFTWTIDTTAPTVTFTSTPTNPSNSSTGAFSFTSNEAGSTFQCQLDAGGFAACSSPKSFTGLSDGSHTVQVKATDTAGNTGTPASFTWTVDTTAPTVTFTSTPTNPSNSSTGAFSFTSNEAGSTFQCQLDAGGFAACSSPKSFTGLSDGSHTVQVKATDTAGNTGTPASFTWTVDTTAPTVTITAPTNGSTIASTTVAVAFTSNEAGSTFQCQLDTAGFSACTSPKSFTGLAQGAHTVQVKATDTAGNTGTPASVTFTVDTVAPTVTFTATPTNPSTTTSASFSFTASESGSTFQCQIDGGGFASCTSPKALSGLGQGSHTFQVKATDAAGNTGTAASFTWTIDSVAPVISFDDAPPDQWPVNYYDIAFSANETATFLCSLNGATFTACTSPTTVSFPYNTTSTFTVQATDTAGNKSTSSTSWVAVDGLVLHYGWEQGATHNTSLLAQRKAFSPDGDVTTQAVEGGWAGTALVSPKKMGFKGTTRVLTSSASKTYTASFWVLPKESLGTGGLIWSNQSSTAGISMTIQGFNLTMSVLDVGGKVQQVKASLPILRWSNVTVRVPSPGKGVELWVDDVFVGTAPTSTTGFESTQADLVVGALVGGTVIDELTFYNVGLTDIELCTTIMRGFVDANGTCQKNKMGWDLRFEDAVTFSNDGDFGMPTNAPQNFTLQTGTLGKQIIIGDALGFSVSGFNKVIPTTQEHTLALWFESGSQFSADTLMDFTTQCVAGKPQLCGIQITFSPPDKVTVFAGTTTKQVSASVLASQPGFHSLVVAEQRDSATSTTKQLTIFIDGKATVLSVGSGDVYTRTSDTVFGPRTNGFIVDEWRFFPRDLSADDAMLCENGFGGEFNPADGTCAFVANK